MMKRRYGWVVAGAAIVAVIGGAEIIGAAHWATPAAADAPPPYVYEAVSDEASPEAAELAALVPGASVATVALHPQEPDRAVATVEVVTLPDGNEVIVGWTVKAAEPVLRSDISSKEDLSLVTALRKHLPEGSTVIALPMLSARLAPFVPADFPLAGAEAQQALRLPAPWVGLDETVATIESRWLGDATSNADAFPTLIDALLAEDIYGAARLQVLAGASDTYVVLHIRDIFDVGLNVPDRLHVALRDFPAAGLAHDKSRAVKEWALAQDHAAYAVERRPDGVVRAYYLHEPKDKSTLIGQLLPFDSAMIGQVAGTTLVFQTGGYWVYRLQRVIEPM